MANYLPIESPIYVNTRGLPRGLQQPPFKLRLYLISWGNVAFSYTHPRGVTGAARTLKKRTLSWLESTDSKNYGSNTRN